MVDAVQLNLFLSRLFGGTPILALSSATLPFLSRLFGGTLETFVSCDCTGFLSRLFGGTHLVL